MKASDSEVDRFIQESCRSFKECSIKNTARRNSLQRKTLGIESERRLASAQMTREERMLRQQLKQMNIEKAKNHIMHNIRETKAHRAPPKAKPKKDDNHVISSDPYPITFRSHTPSPTELERHMESTGRSYSALRQRRQSREFEDLKLHSETGKLHVDDGSDNDGGLRRRVNSMSYVQHPRIRHQRHLDHHSNASTPRGSPRVSPNLRRRVLSPRLSKKKGDSSGSSREDVKSIGSLDDLHWVGEPEAIHSVRRPRKTVEEQEIEAEFHKLGIK